MSYKFAVGDLVLVKDSDYLYEHRYDSPTCTTEMRRDFAGKLCTVLAVSEHNIEIQIVDEPDVDHSWWWNEDWVELWVEISEVSEKQIADLLE